MRISVQVQPGLLHAILMGGEALDLSDAACIRSAVIPRIEPETAVILSMGSVSSIDSAGIGVLVAILKTVKDKGGRMALVAPQPSVLSVLDLTRLSTVVEIYPDKASALAALGLAPADRPT